MGNKLEIRLVISSIASFIFKRKIHILLCTVISLILGYITVHYTHIRLSSFKELSSSLQVISAAVFTIAGLWVAYSYPEAISVYTKENVKFIDNGETKRIENLVLIILSSCFVVMGLLIWWLMYTIFTSIQLKNTYILNLRMIAISVIYMLCYVQLLSLFKLILMNIYFVNNLTYKKAEKEADDDL